MNIQKQLGSLEEQLERIESILANASPGAEDSLTELSAPIAREIRSAKKSATIIKTTVEENILWEKSFTLDIICNKLVRYILRETGKFDIPISIVQCYSGKIPQTITGPIMSILSTVIKIIVERFNTESDENRIDYNKSLTRCVSLNLIGDSDFLSINIMDDGPRSSKSGKDFNAEFSKIRTEVAKRLGFCSFKFHSKYGFQFHLKLGLPRSRVRANLMQFATGNLVAIPKISVINILGPLKSNRFLNEKGKVYFRFEEQKIPVCEIDHKIGIINVRQFTQNDTSLYFLTIIGTADIMLAFITEEKPIDKIVRFEDGNSFLKKNSWHNKFAIFNDFDVAKASPLMDGDTIMQAKENGLIKL